MKSLLLFVLAPFLLCGEAFASTIIVDPGGGGDATTIQGGLDLASAGDMVQVLPGTYVENLVMVSGVWLCSASGPETAIIDGSGGDCCIRCNRCAPGTRIDGFTITNGGGYCAGGILIFDNSHVEVLKNIIRNNHTSYEGAGVQVQRYSYGYIHDNQFLDNLTYHSCAISVIVYSQATIENNLFKNNVSEFLSGGIGLNEASVEIAGNVFLYNKSVNGAAIHAVHPGTSANIHHNTFLFNRGTGGGGTGILVYDGATMFASNNLFGWNHGTPAVISDSYSNLVLGCNDVWENDIDYFGIPDPTGTNGNVRIDPLVCAPLSDEAALSHYSPLLAGPCGYIGANPVPACWDQVPIEDLSWGQVKALYR